MERLKEKEPGKPGIHSDYNQGWNDACDYIRERLEESTSADVAPVVHGRWVYDENAYDWSLGGYVCGLCYALNTNLPSNEKLNPLNFRGSAYCPNCGAKMDGGVG